MSVSVNVEKNTFVYFWGELSLKTSMHRQYSTKNMQFTCVAFIITYFFLQRFCELDYTFHEEKAIIYKNH